MLVLECTPIFPQYDNGNIVSGGNQNAYFPGDVLIYECDQNFASMSNSIECTCDDTNDPDNPEWICSPQDRQETCLRCKCQYYDGIQNHVSNPLF